MEIIKSSLGADMIVYGGFIYRKDKANLNTMYWRCAKEKCKGRLVTILDYKQKEEEEIQLRARGYHSHLPDPMDVKARKALIEAKLHRNKQQHSNYNTRKRQNTSTRVEATPATVPYTSEVNRVKQHGRYNSRKKVIKCIRADNVKMLATDPFTSSGICKIKEEANCELFTSVNNVSNAFSLNSFNGTVQADKQAAEKDMVETVSGNTIEFKLRQSEYMEAQKQQAEFMEAQKQQAEFMEAQKQQAEFMEAQKQQAEKLAEERQQRQNETKVYKYMVLNHEKKILETLRTLWKGNQFCDAMLQNECVSIPVHKILLIACCPKILDTYDYIMKDTNVQVCFPRKVSADALRAFVDYLYSGSLNLSKSILDSMEYLSGMLGLDDICQLCNQFRLDLFNDSSNMPDKTIVNVSHSQNSSGLHLSLANRSTTPPPPIVRLSSHTALSASSTTNIRMSSSPHYQDNRRVSYSQKSSESRYSILPEQSAESDVLNVNSIKLEPEVDLTVDDCTEVKQEMATYQSSEDCQFGSWSQIDSQSDDSLSHRKKNNSTNFDIQTTVDLSVMPLKSFTTGHSQKASSHDDPDLQSVITISPSNSPLHSPTSVDSSPEVQTFEVDSETPNLKTHLNPYPVSLVMANTHNLSLPENNRKKKNSFDDFDVDFECKKSKISLH